MAESGPAFERRELLNKRRSGSNNPYPSEGGGRLGAPRAPGKAVAVASRQEGGARGGGGRGGAPSRRRWPLRTRARGERWWLVVTMVYREATKGGRQAGMEAETAASPVRYALRSIHAVHISESQDRTHLLSPFKKKSIF